MDTNPNMQSRPGQARPGNATLCHGLDHKPDPQQPASKPMASPQDTVVPESMQVFRCKPLPAGSRECTAHVFPPSCLQGVYTFVETCPLTSMLSQPTARETIGPSATGRVCATASAGPNLSAIEPVPCLLARWCTGLPLRKAQPPMLYSTAPYRPAPQRVQRHHHPYRSKAEL